MANELECNLRAYDVSRDTFTFCFEGSGRLRVSARAVSIDGRHAKLIPVSGLEPATDGRVRFRRHVAHGPRTQPRFQIPGPDQVTLFYQIPDVLVVVVGEGREGHVAGSRPAAAPSQ